MVERWESDVLRERKRLVIVVVLEFAYNVVGNFALRM